MSSSLTSCVVLLTVTFLNGAEGLTLDRSTIAPVVTVGESHGTCPTREVRQMVMERIKDNIKRRIPVTNRNCGEGEWHRIAYLDMKDSAQSCPSAWREYTSSSARVCGRPVASSGSCIGTLYPAGCQYSKVCGRLIGYQVGTTDGFSNSRIDQAYVDGVSVTYGTPRNHIWTFGSGFAESGVTFLQCPCSDTPGRQPPSFVGDNYFCESGHSQFGRPNSNDKLWDGEQCSNEGACCTGPPWFTVDLPNNSTDDIEVRICGSESTSNEDTPLELVEIYI